MELKSFLHLCQEQCLSLWKIKIGHLGQPQVADCPVCLLELELPLEYIEEESGQDVWSAASLVRLRIGMSHLSSGKSE